MDPLRQRMVLALSEICVVSVLGVDSAWRQFALAHYGWRCGRSQD